MKYIIALDQGTTSSRAIVFDQHGRITAAEQSEFRQIYPRPGWVEHDPMEIWKSQQNVMLAAIRKGGLKSADIAAIGITNQRETTMVWDRQSGEPIHHAIVWQDKRTAGLCAQMKRDGMDEHVRRHTGLVIDAYFSSTKLAWLLDNIEGARRKAENGELLFGTIDTWLLWKLTGGKVHATDFSNASRTMLYDIHTLEWDPVLLDYFKIPRSMMPEVKASGTAFGTHRGPDGAMQVLSILGDQQAALFGQACFDPGMAKNTYGTGAFVLMNTGEDIWHSKNGLITTLAWGLGGKVHHALEGSIFIAGAAIQWLRDELKILDDAEDSAWFAAKAEEDEVYFVPAFAGLGAPYWDMSARGAIFGITRDTGKKHLIKAALQSMAYQTRAVLEAMEKDSSLELSILKADGGASANDYLMQFQADLLQVPVERPVITESTAWGAASLAGIVSGMWDQQRIREIRKVDHTFDPAMAPQQGDQLFRGWQKAVDRAGNWIDES